MNPTDVRVTLTMDEAISVLAALKVAGEKVTREHADSATRKIENEIYSVPFDAPRN